MDQDGNRDAPGLSIMFEVLVGGVRMNLTIVLLATIALGAMAITLVPPSAIATDAGEIQYAGPLPSAAIPKYIADAVASTDRPAADRQMDKSRRPDQMMAFFGIKPGMQVADLWAGGGYTSEVLARVVGPTGKVYSQNNIFPEKFKAGEKAWQARTSEPGLGNIVEVTKPFDAPDLIPTSEGTLDAVIINLNYHDMVGQGFDRTKINSSVLKALKPGGVYGLVDNSARAGTGAADANTLHRIDESFEIKEIESAGFRLVATSDIYRNPADDRTWPFFKARGTQDRFALKFVKP
jgi:predicted methyltransferase